MFMYILKRWTCRKISLFTVLILMLCYMSYYYSITKVNQPYIPNIRIRSIGNILFKKISIVHYTTTFGKRTDSHSDLFNTNLKQICEILDPEEYLYADSAIVSLVDFVRFPSLSNKNISYRNKYQSQLWLLHIEESPRNSYRTVQMNNIIDLDDWFNLTTTLRPESDLHIQYKGYRIKPEIINLITNKLNLTHNYHPTNSKIFKEINIFKNESSIYLKTLASILNKEFNDRQNNYLKACPFTCNQPLSNDLVQSLQPYLKPIIPHILSRDIVHIAWFVSNCYSHSGREEYVSKLRSQPGIRVDIYGECSSIFNKHFVPIQCRKGTPKCMEETLSNYRFYLAFENSKCDTYITEKYWMQGLSGKAIPIVLGAKREQYQRIAVPNSYIHVDNYQTIEQLAHKLHRLNKNDSEYIKYLQWTQLYDLGGDYSPTARYDMYSTLCFLGHYQRLHAMKQHTKPRTYLLKRIRQIFDLENVRLPNFNWETARTKLIKISKFHNPKVNCWDNDYPTFLKRAYNFFFLWSKLF
ncbi:unnamed protein product [Adineta steineri]|nr:unnamed protein product [Adineta steineri]